MGEFHTTNGGRRVHEGFTDSEWDDIPPSPIEVRLFTLITTVAAVAWGVVAYFAIRG